MSVKGDSLTTRHLTLQILCGIFPFFPLPLSPRCSVLVLIRFASSHRAAKPRLCAPCPYRMADRQSWQVSGNKVEE